MPFEVKIISPEQTKPLRHKVLWPHIEKEDDCTIDIDYREDAIHLGAFSEGQLVSIGSLFAMSSPHLSMPKQYRLRAMASDPQVRKQGSGKALIEYGIELLKAKDQDVLWCDARIIAVGFYRRLGFLELPEVYDVPKIGPHQFMWIPLR